MSHVPEAPQSPSLQQYLAHCMETQVMPALQKVITSSHGWQMGASIDDAT
jgi:hypothetical protein